METNLSNAIPTNTERIEKLEKRLFNRVGTALSDFNMISEGDRIMVAISGGKDSWVLLHLLNEFQKKAPIDYEIVAVNIDQGYSGFRQDIVEDYVRARGIKYHMEFVDISTPVLDKLEKEGTIPCSLCSRLRRGSLYGLAEKLNCNKIALGHHQDDLIETLLLNAFYVGRLASMAPKLKADDGRNIVIRPLVYVKESEIVEYTKLMKFPVVCCECPLMCGENIHADHKRRKVKNLITELEKEIPEIRNSLLGSLTNVNPSHLLDLQLHKFND